MSHTVNTANIRDEEPVLEESHNGTRDNDSAFPGDEVVMAARGLVDLGDDASSPTSMDHHNNGDDDDGATDGSAAGDVVEVDVAESDDASHHHTPQLVEGDFFPSDAPADVAAELEGADGEAAVAELVAESVPSSSRPSTVQTPQQLPPPREATPRKRRRVQWADGVVADADPHQHRRSLIKHVTTFYMPQSAHRDHDLHGQRHPLGFGAAADSGLFPEPVSAPAASAVAIFKERENSNGEPYLFCRAQRVAPRFVEWKREHHAALEVPFVPQPGAAQAHAVTLFAALYPPTQTVATPSSARSQAAIMNIHNNLQMPFIRHEELFDQPLSFA